MQFLVTFFWLIIFRSILRAMAHIYSSQIYSELNGISQYVNKLIVIQIPLFTN